jgi:translocation and assembly module TamA
MCDSVAYLYWSMGYIDVKVTCTEDTTGGAVVVDISEGDVSSIVAVDIAGASEEGRALIAPVFESMIGEPFSPEGFDLAVAEALRAYDEAGYPVASIAPEITAAGGSGLGVTLRVEEGPRATIGSLVFEGVTSTRLKVLQRETGLKIGEPYDGSKVEAARQNLLRLGVFEDVSEARLSINPADSSLVVTFEAVEARTSFAEGVVAYGPTPTGNELYGQLEIDLRNIAGTLRKAGVYWMSRGSGRSAWAVHYREPRIVGLPVALEGAIDSDIDETAYERRRLSLRVVQQEGRHFELSAGWFLASVREGPLVEGVADEDTRSTYDENGFDLGLAIDRTDRVINPTRGATALLALELSSLRCDACEEPGSQPDRRLWSVLVGGSYAFGISGRAVGFLGARLHVVNSDKGEVPPSHLIRVGGVNTLRGYPEEWFVTKEVAIVTAELRYVVGPRSRVYLFLDAGTLTDESHEITDLGTFLAGYGVGLTTGSRIGVFRVEVATARGEPLSEAKLHLKLTQRF